MAQHACKQKARVAIKGSSFHANKRLWWPHKGVVLTGVDLIFVNLVNLLCKDTGRNEEPFGAALGNATQGRRAPPWWVSLFVLEFVTNLS